MYNDLEIGCKYKYKLISNIENPKYVIQISHKRVYRTEKNGKRLVKLDDRLHKNKLKDLILNAGMLTIDIFL